MEDFSQAAFDVFPTIIDSEALDAIFASPENAIESDCDCDCAEEC
jgi:hypothetical protein